MSDLPDPPTWSFLRRALIVLGFAWGAGMTWRAGAVSDASVALSYISQGTDLMVWMVGLYVGGASTERLGAWWGRGKP